MSDENEAFFQWEYITVNFFGTVEPDASSSHPFRCTFSSYCRPVNCCLAINKGKGIEEIHFLAAYIAGVRKRLCWETRGYELMMYCRRFFSWYSASRLMKSKKLRTASKKPTSQHFCGTLRNRNVLWTPSNSYMSCTAWHTSCKQALRSTLVEINKLLL